MDQELPLEQKVCRITGQELFRVKGDDGCWYPTEKKARASYVKVMKYFGEGGHTTKKH